jgi:hypothetical protein
MAGLNKPNEVTWTLQVVGGPVGRASLFKAILQAMHAGLEKLGAEMAKEEAWLAAEHTRLMEVWCHFHMIVVAGRQAEESQRLRCKAKEIRDGASDEAEDILAKAHERIMAANEREEALAAYEASITTRERVVSSHQPELLQREKEVVRWENDLVGWDNELSTEHGRLETL